MSKSKKRPRAQRKRVTRLIWLRHLVVPPAGPATLPSNHVSSPSLPVRCNSVPVWFVNDVNRVWANERMNGVYTI
jgi:hypothetical protein